MKKLIVSTLLGISACSTAWGIKVCCPAQTCCDVRDNGQFSADNIFGKTHFTAQPYYSSVRPEHLTGLRDRLGVHEDSIWGALQAVVFGGQTTSKHAQDWGRYFYPCNKCELVVASQDDITAICCNSLGPIGPGCASGTVPFVTASRSEFFGKHDVLAEHFGLSNYDTRMKIIPSQSFIGGALTWRHEPTKKETHGFWYEIVLPVVHVKNCVELVETNYLGYMVEAFQNERLCHGQISKCCLDCCEAACNDCCCRNWTEFKSTGLENTEIKLWYDFLRTDCCRYGSTIGVIFPSTDQEPSQRFLFSPLAGHRHFGLQWGHSLQVDLWNYQDWYFSTAIDMRGGYLFGRDECRQFELCGKPWSRYMNFWAEEAEPGNRQLAAPGVCCLTLPAKVTPRNFCECNIGFVADVYQWQFEAGYHLLCRQSEKIEICPCDREFTCGIANAAGAVSAVNGTKAIETFTQSSATIKHIGLCDDSDAEGKRTFIPIRLQDIDLNSAAHPSAISHTVYGAINYRIDDRKHPLSFGMGGSYTFSADNATARRWSLWGKCIVSF